MKLNIQSYLETHSANQLATEHGIYLRPSKDGLIFNLNYDQLESKNYNPLTWECRGLVLARVNGKPYIDLDEVVGETLRVSVTFKRFFNMGEPIAAKMDWESAKYGIKMDGTFASLFKHPFKNEWCVSTRSVPEANIPFESITGMTFRGLFELCLRDTNGLTFNEFTGKLNEDYTYMFEICSPLNRVVVAYPNHRLVLLGIKNKETCEEIEVPDSLFGIPKFECFDFRTVEEVIWYINTFGATELEGVVACDKYFNRVKIKSIAYLAAARVKASCGSLRALLELVLTEKADDVRCLLSEEYCSKLDELTEKVANFIKTYDLVYETLEKGSRKEFAIDVQKKNLFMAPLMERFVGKVTSTKEWISGRKIQTKEGNGYPDSFLDKLLELMYKG